MKEYDVIIVGGGKAGYTAALRAADIGARTILIEKDRLGGNWIYNGVFPLRYLLQSFGRMQWINPVLYEKAGFKNGGPLDVPRLLQSLRQTAESFSENWKHVLESKHIKLIQGIGKGVRPGSVLVETPSGEETILANKVIIATGSITKEFPSLPCDGERVVTGDSLLSFDELPGQVLVAGGQAQGCELATVLNRLGCKVFICEEGERLVRGQDKDLTGLLEEELRRQKIKLLLNKKILSIYKKKEKIDVSLDGGIQFSTEKIILTQDRKPCSQIVSSEGVRLGEYEEILVDETMETSQEQVFAIGSVTRTWRNSRLSEEEARVVVYNGTGRPRSLNPDRVPFIISSCPELASVGCTADEAHHKGFGIGVEGICRLDPLNPCGEPESPRGLLKLVADRSTRQIIGCQILASNASEWISWALLSIKKKLTLKDLAQFPSGFDGVSKAFREAANAVIDSIKPLN